jgi:hypothetical protein
MRIFGEFKLFVSVLFAERLINVIKYRVRSDIVISYNSILLRSPHFFLANSFSILLHGDLLSFISADQVALLCSCSTSMTYNKRLA